MTQARRGYSGAGCRGGSARLGFVDRPPVLAPNDPLALGSERCLRDLCDSSPAPCRQALGMTSLSERLRRSARCRRPGNRSTWSRLLASSLPSTRGKSIRAACCGRESEQGIRRGSSRGFTSKLCAMPRAGWRAQPVRLWTSSRRTCSDSAIASIAMILPSAVDAVGDRTRHRPIGRGRTTAARGWTSPAVRRRPPKRSRAPRFTVCAC